MDGETTGAPQSEAAAGSEERSLPDHPVLRALFEQVEEADWQPTRIENVAVVPREQLRRFAEAARDAGFEMCADLTAVDYLGRRPVRFEVVVGLLSLQHRLRLRLRVPVPADNAEVPSLVPLYPGTNFLEREVYDMFGITFPDHPDMTRILMPDDWVGHPLRKDYAVGAVPVQFKDAPRVT